MNERPHRPSASRVVFVQKFVPHYRLAFFEALRAALAAVELELVLVHGEPDRLSASKLRTVSPDWAPRSRGRVFSLAGRPLHWLGALGASRPGDIVVTEHAVKVLDNYPLQLLGRLGRRRFCYFGHGANFQGEGEDALTGWLRRRTLLPVARWFAYTERSAERLREQGVPGDIITVVDNALDPGVTAEPDATPERHAFVYAGGLYAEKRLDFLLEAGAELAVRLPEFRLTLIGDGPLAPAMREAAARLPWLRVPGALYGAALAAEIAAARAILMPGMVGLVVIDAFARERPLVTRAAAQHSPEIAYLEDGVNGLIVAGETVADYADAVERIARDDALHERLQQGCRAAAARYTVANMVERFVAGLQRVAAGR